MGNFSGRPYFRMCVGFLNELSPTDPADEAGWRYLQVREEGQGGRGSPPALDPGQLG